MTKKEQRINRLFLYAGILTLIYYLGQGITVRFGQSLLYLWLMLSAVCFGRFFLWKWAWKHGKSAPIPRLWLRAVNIVVIAAVAVFLAVECLVFSGAFQKPRRGWTPSSFSARESMKTVRAGRCGSASAPRVSIWRKTRIRYASPPAGRARTNR